MIPVRAPNQAPSAGAITPKTPGSFTAKGNKEIRIEGHTSAAWTGTTDEKTAYFKNMELSQARTRSALEYLLSLPAVRGDERWLVQHVTANGLSSSRPLAPDSQSAASQAANQRVEFRIVTNASEKMDLIADKLSKK
ncbi:OmpA family protein [Paraburkholderia sp. SEWSISQ10-3 4]|uniref:OmpA family protein n=1 Tax=Paraburkholderia TaxID=1822464 RepID=UPI002255EB06|nr:MULTISPECIES: OmpA family protein [Paraburkholderia]MCX4136777.1 OmpA family protein [Paraburkholderia aspalathi]MDN7169469.1 OmpA family protein [Paraburkholderia sp. SEWSISQ10-3 4]MDQ6499108.1 OmpA family protein [Paraburkholderia aspalathi]